MLQPGTMLGEYRILDLLGRGGMGEVYRAQHAKIGRFAAVKVLTGAAQTAEALERFKHEACVQSRLQHPHIAALYDFTEVAGQPCIIMEYVDGQALSELIAARGPLAISDALAIFQAVVEAVAYIHSCAIVHRDIKPNNIKINSRGEVKLLDFGIARSELTRGLTATGQVIGTIEYLAPEQLQTGRADARSDIWALGALLYEMLTGRSPFAAPNLGAICERINRAAFEPPSHLNPLVSPGIEKIIGRCLRRDPTSRYQTAHELLEDLERERARLRATEPKDPSSRITAMPHRRPVVWALLGTVLVLCAFLAIRFIGNGRRTSTSSPLPIAGTNQASTATKEAGAKTVLIDVFEGRAEVYRDNRFLGTTPYELRASPGERIQLELRREGFQDKPVEFTVSETRHVYTFRMER